MDIRADVVALDGVYGEARILFKSLGNGLVRVDIVQSGNYVVESRHLTDVCKQLIAVLRNEERYYCDCVSCTGSEQAHKYKCECPKD